MIEFFKRLFAPEPSGATAKERLRLVLLSDHLQLAPEVVEALRRDVIAVINKYVEVDEAHCDVSFEQQDRAVAVLANIPILAIRDDRSSPPPSAPPPSDIPPRHDAPPVPDRLGAAYAVDDAAESHAVEDVAEAAPTAVPASRPPRRRRRRRRSAGSVSVPAAG